MHTSFVDSSPLVRRARWSSTFVLALALAGCSSASPAEDGADASGSDGGAGNDGGPGPDAGGADGGGSDGGGSDGGGSDGGSVDGGAVTPDAGPLDGSTSSVGIVATTIGTLETTHDAISAVPYGTRGNELLAALTLTIASTAVLEDGAGGALDPDETYVDEDVVVVVAAGATERTYELGMEVLTNTAVLIVGDDAPRRLSTRFFPNGPGEWIVLDKSSFTHFCMPRDVPSGTYGPDDGAATSVCLEIEGLTGVDGMGGSTSGDDLTVELDVATDGIRGRFHGELDVRGGAGGARAVRGWFSSDRVDSGGW